MNRDFTQRLRLWRGVGQRAFMRLAVLLVVCMAAVSGRAGKTTTGRIKVYLVNTKAEYKCKYRFLLFLFALCPCVAQMSLADGGAPSKYASATEILPNREPDFTLDDVTKLYGGGSWTYTLYKRGATDGEHITFRVIGKAEAKDAAEIKDNIGGTECITTASSVYLYGGAVLQIESSKGRILTVHFGNVAKVPITGKAADAKRNVNIYPYTDNGYYGSYIWDDNTIWTKGQGVAKQLIKTNSVNFLALGDPANNDGEHVILYNSNENTAKNETYETSDFGINVWIDNEDDATAVSPVVTVEPAETNVKTEQAFSAPTSVTVLDGDEDITSHYTIQYVMAGMKPASTTSDITTGTTVSRSKGNGATGTYPGTAEILVVAVPKTTDYNLAFGSYKVTSTTKKEIALPYLPESNKGKIIIYTKQNQWNATQYDGVKTKIGAKVQTESGTDVTSDYTLSFALDADTYATVGSGDDNGMITSVAPTPDDTYAKLTITATPSDGGETLTKEVDVKVIALTTNDKLDLNLFYSEGEDSIMVYYGDRFILPSPIAVDNYGNVQTGLTFVASNRPHNPTSVTIAGSSKTFDCSVYSFDQPTSMAGWLNMDSIVVYAQVGAYSSYNTLDDRVIYTSYGVQTIRSTDWNALATDSVLFIVNSQLRSPELSFSPSDEITISQDMKFSMQNRIEVAARFYDRSDDNYDSSGNAIDDSETLHYGGSGSGSGYSYALYIPDSWADSVEVINHGGLMTDAYYIDYATGDTIKLPGKYYWTTKNWGNDGTWYLKFKKAGDYSLQYYVKPYNTEKYQAGVPTATSALKFHVVQIPTYSVGWELDTNSEYKPGHWLKVSTTNAPTDIIMYYGGWRNGTYWDGKSDNNDDGGYHVPTGGRACDAKGTNRIGGWEDKWKEKWGADYANTGKDFVGSLEGITDSERTLLVNEYNADSLKYNAYIDFFDTYIVNTDDNAMDERNQQYTSYNYREGSYYDYLQYLSGSFTRFYNTAFTAPCKGDYIRFEPEEDGTLLVYLVQNGVCDYTGSFDDESDDDASGSKKTKNDKKCQIKWRPLFITDEKGKPVDILPDNDPLFEKYELDDSIAVNHTGYYTQGILRATWNDATVKSRVSGIKGAVAYSDCAYDWQNFQGTEDDKANIVKLWKSLNVGGPQSVIKLDNGGYVILTKGYVRYTFPVNAGKTYFIMQGGSKPEIGGFSFIPEGYDPDGTRTDVSIPEVALYTRTDDTGYQSHEDVISSTADTTNVNVTLKGHRLRNGEWTSLCLPFSLSEKKVNELFGESAIVITPDTARNGAIHFTQHAYRMMVAGRPYLVKPTCLKGTTGALGEGYGKDDSFVFNNVTIENTDPTIYNDTVCNVVFRGFYNPITLNKGEYFVSDKGLYRSSVESYTHPGYSAIFANYDSTSETPKLATNAININVIGIDGETSAILEVRNDADGQRIVDVSGDKVYTIDGRYVGERINTNTLPSGIYVCGGNKIVVK